MLPQCIFASHAYLDILILPRCILEYSNICKSCILGFFCICKSCILEYLNICNSWIFSCPCPRAYLNILICAYLDILKLEIFCSCNRLVCGISSELISSCRVKMPFEPNISSLSFLYKHIFLIIII